MFFFRLHEMILAATNEENEADDRRETTKGKMTDNGGKQQIREADQKCLLIRLTLMD